MKRIVIFVLLFAFAKAYSQDTAKSVTLYWDVSYSMKERNLAAEKQFLNEYFSETPNTTLTFVAFSNEIIEKDNFSIIDGDWTALEQRLDNTVYDGASNYNLLDFSEKTPYILSTDGAYVFEKLPSMSSSPVIVINSLYSENVQALEVLATISDGDFIKLYNSNKDAESDDALKLFGTVTGQVGDTVGPIPNVNVRVLNKPLGTTTDKDGGYTISASPGDVLVFSYIGKKTRRIRVVDRKLINVNLDYEEANLDEVVISGKKKKEVRTINSGYGEIKEEQLGYDVQSIDDDDITVVNTDVSTAIQGQFSGVKLNRNADLSRVKIRTAQTIFGNQYGLIVIDGIPQQQADSAADTRNPGRIFTDRNFQTLDPENIESITVLKGMAATNKYGTLGVNGVILITTKFAQKNPDNSVKDVPLGTTPTYDGNAESIGTLANTPYIDELKTKETIEAAYESYIKQREIYGTRPEFYIDVADYFKGWGNPAITKRTLSNVYELFPNDVEAMRALAYKLEENSMHSLRVKVLKRVQDIRPEEIRSYRDLALAYRDAGAIEDAFETYSSVMDTGIPNVQLGGLSETLTKEYKHFLAKHKQDVNISQVSPQFLRNKEILDRRVVIEWNDPRSLFDLQIINPQKRYFTWEHTQKGALQRLIQERDQGFASEEFFMTANDKGTWTFNLVNYGFIENDNGQPSFIKFTVYENYGKPNEKKTIKVVRLAEIDKEFTALSITI